MTQTPGNSGDRAAIVLDATRRAAEAGAMVVQNGADRRGTITWESKGPADFVSEIDRSAEEAIRAVLREHFPDASVIGEELGPDETLDRGLTFIVDPLDGTTNFLHGYPEYAVSIGVWENGEELAGVILNAASGEMFTAARGHGAYRDGERIHVSSIVNPGRALFGTGFPFREIELLEPYTKQFAAVARAAAGIRRAGSAALDFASVACGRFDGFWEMGLSAWDVAGGIVMVREAGGVVTHLDGSPAVPRHGAYVAGNPEMHRWLLETVRAAESGIIVI